MCKTEIKRNRDRETEQVYDGADMINVRMVITYFQGHQAVEEVVNVNKKKETRLFTYHSRVTTN